MMSEQANYHDRWVELYGEIAAPFGSLANLMSVLGVTILVASMVSWTWRRSTGLDSRSGATALAAVLGTVLAAPTIIIPLTLRVIDFVLNAFIGVFDDGEPSPSPTPAPDPTPRPEPPREPIDVPWDIIGLVFLALVGLAVCGLVGYKVTGAAKAHRAVKRTRRSEWRDLTDRHDAIREEVGEIHSSPLKSLMVSALNDMSHDRTRAYVRAYARAGDLRSLLGDEVPADTDRIGEFAEAVRDLEGAWRDAIAYASKVGYAWMPDEDRRRVRRAIALLKTAENPAASDHERLAALRTARGLIDDVTSITLNEVTLDALESARRHALETVAGEPRPEPGRGEQP